MRISDWSSDVCSSDLIPDARRALGKEGPAGADAVGRPNDGSAVRKMFGHANEGFVESPLGALIVSVAEESIRIHRRTQLCGNANSIRLVSASSDEHTSELPSIMRISYAVFCLIQNTNQ